MEVSGKTNDQAGGGLYCLPCKTDDLTEPVYGYCQTCQEHLCESCFKHHRRSLASRDHVLLNQDAMPKIQTMSARASTDELDFCTSHKDKRLEFYCNKHNTTACYVCVTLDHTACKVKYIPDISGNITESAEFIGTMKQLQILKEKCQDKLEEMKASIDKIHKCHGEFLEEINLFRKEINDCLDKMQREVTKEIEILVNSRENSVSVIAESCHGIINEVGAVESSLDTLKEDGQYNRLFVEMKQTEEIITTLNTEAMKTMMNEEMLGTFEFSRNHKILQLLNSEPFGNIVSHRIDQTFRKKEDVNKMQDDSVMEKSLPSEDKSMNLQLSATVDVNFTSDKKECYIRGIVLIPTHSIVVADSSNQSIKLIDMENQRLVTEYKLTSSPLDVISLPQGKLAVALTGKYCIEILSLTGTTMSFNRRINVGESCCCLAFYNDKLVVGCDSNPRKVVIMDLTGKKLQQFDLHDIREGINNIFVSRDGENIYCSTGHWFGSRGTLVKMDLQGDISQLFQSEPCYNPKDIQELEDGTLLVCYKGSGKLMRLSSSFKECTITGLENAALYRPWAIAYDEKQHKLYVSCASRSGGLQHQVKVFDLAWI